MVLVVSETAEIVQAHSDAHIPLLVAVCLSAAAWPFIETGPGSAGSWQPGVSGSACG